MHYSLHNTHYSCVFECYILIFKKFWSNKELGYGFDSNFIQVLFKFSNQIYRLDLFIKFLFCYIYSVFDISNTNILLMNNYLDLICFENLIWNVFFFKYHYHISQLNFHLKLILIHKNFVHKVYFDK